jgi:cytochrome c553
LAPARINKDAQQLHRKAFTAMRSVRCGVTALAAMAGWLCVPAAIANSLTQRGEYVARAADCVSCHTEPGVKAQGSWGAMGSFAPSLSDQQIADVTNYLRTTWNNDGRADATAWMVGNWRGVAQLHGEPAALTCPTLEVNRSAEELEPEAMQEAKHEDKKLKS